MEQVDNDMEHDQGLDEVVAEIPVYLSKELLQKLYLIQYPLRPANLEFDESEVLEAKIKPAQDKIQLTLGIDTSTTRYDKKVGEKMGIQMDGIENWTDRDPDDERPLFDEYQVESTGIPEPAKSKRYVVGVIRNGHLNLTPLKSIVQMKPIFPQMNKSDNSSKKVSNTGAESAGDTEDETEEEATKVTVKFTQARGQPGKDRQSKSYNAIKKRQEEEPWIDLEYVSENPLEFDKLCSGVRENETPFYVIKNEEYLDELMPKHVEVDVDTPIDIRKKPGTAVVKRLNVNQLKVLPLPDQLKAIMLNASVLQFNQVIDFLQSKLQVTFPDQSDILRSIQTVAILVQGCWVVRSELVYSADYVSSAHGIPGPIMQKARDIILHQFTQKNTTLDRERLRKITRLPNEEVTEILSKIAFRREVLTGGMPRHGWEFIQPYDHEFVSKHPEVVQRQTSILEMKLTSKVRNTSSSSSSVGASSSDIKPPMSNPPSRRRSRTKSYSSDTDSSETEMKVNLGPQRRNSINNSTSGRPEASFRPKAEPN